jgi:hypothetical protein
MEKAFLTLMADQEVQAADQVAPDIRMVGLAVVH